MKIKFLIAIAILVASFFNVNASTTSSELYVNAVNNWDAVQALCRYDAQIEYELKAGCVSQTGTPEAWSTSDLYAGSFNAQAHAPDNNNYIVSGSTSVTEGTNIFLISWGANSNSTASGRVWTNDPVDDLFKL